MVLKAKELNLKKRVYKRKSRKLSKRTEAVKQKATKRQKAEKTVSKFASIEDSSEKFLDQNIENASTEFKESSVKDHKDETHSTFHLGNDQREEVPFTTFRDPFWQKEDLFSQNV